MTVHEIRPTGRRRRAMAPFTVPHFREYCSRLVFDDGKRRDPEPWQLDYAGEIFRAMRAGEAGAEEWLVVPEGNGKTTLVAQIGLYGVDWAPRPWIPVGAHSRDQAKTTYTQAKGFVDETPGLARRFRCFDGYRAIRPLNTSTGKPRAGRGLEIYPWDPDSNDGIIPFPFFICDELHRHPDMSLWRLWKGKCRKRGAIGIGISTAGEPGQEFEAARDNFRQNATRSEAKHGGRLYRGRKYGMLEFRLQNPEKALDVTAVAKVNPLSTVTPDALRDDLESPTFDLGDWQRLKCNIAARSSKAAISDEEWAHAISREYDEIPEEVRTDCGLDLGWKHDTTAFVRQWKTPEGYWLWEEARVLVPPRDGSMLPVDDVKRVLFDLTSANPIDSLVMDMSDGADIAQWAKDELGVTIVDRGQGIELKVADYKNVMRGLRTGTLKRVKNCPLLTRHSMNAIGRRLPRGDHVFERPSQVRANAAKQDVRVIDALVAASMVFTNDQVPEVVINLDDYRVQQL